MGYAKRYLLAVTLFMLVSSVAVPALLGGPEGVNPPGVVLPGDGGTATLELDVVNDSVVISSNLEVEGGPATRETVTKAGPDTTIGFFGEVDFGTPSPDLSWYLGEQFDSRALQRASDVDGLHLRNNATLHAYQLYLLDVDPRGLFELNVSWTGCANATIDTELHTGARLYAYNNASYDWDMVAYFDEEADVDHELGGRLPYRAVHYVNRTLTGQQKVIILIITNWERNSKLSTDAISITATYIDHPRPRIDVGDDGSVEWGFGTNGSTGALGYVDTFVGDRDQIPVTFPLGGGFATSPGFLVPKGAQASSALIDYRAFPTTGERSGMGPRVWVDPNWQSGSLEVTDIPENAHQSQSSVLLTDVYKHNITDQAVEYGKGYVSLSVGRGPSNQSLAQIFQPAFDGYISGIDVFIEAKQGNPGDLTLRLLTAYHDYIEGTILGEVTLREWEIMEDSWNHFPLEPVYLKSTDYYAFSLHAIDAGQPISSWVVLYNTSNPYPSGEAFQNPDLNDTYLWMSLFDYDLCFRTYMDLPIDAQDANKLLLDGNHGIMVPSGVVFNVSEVWYAEHTWNFQISNTNDFPVSFNWSAWTRFLIFTEGPSLDVGNDGPVEWKGHEVWATETINFTSELNVLLARPDWPLTVEDEFGNVFYRIPLNLTAESEGEVALQNLAIRYKGSLATSDFADVLNTEKANRTAGPDGIVKVPVTINSSSPGTLNVTVFNIEYDLPPYSLAIEDVVFDEDGQRTINLDTIIFDDYDNNVLEYTVVKEAGDEALAFEVSDRSILLLYGPANWSGSARFHITAVDRSNLSYTTNPFNVTVRAVNDPPLLMGLSDQEVYFGVTKAVPVEIVDNDSSIENVTITTSTSRVWYDPGNGTMVLLYPNASISETVEVNVSDGQGFTSYSIDVDPRESNEPPTIDLPASFLVTLDVQGVLDLTPYATDLETSKGQLVWSIVSAPVELVVSMQEGHILQVIPVATVEGNHSIELNVTDLDGNVAQASLLVKLRWAARNPPVILRGDDALPARIKVEREGSLVLNLALQKYWYDQEDYNRPDLVKWEVTSLRPNLFTVEIDAEHRLVIRSYDRTGAGYITFRLIDSDGDVSNTESMQVEVVEPASAKSSWLMYGLAMLVLIIVVGLLMVASKRRGAARPKPPKPPVEKPFAEEPIPARPPAIETPAESTPPEAPPTSLPGRIVQVLVIHDSTSLITQMTGDEEHQLPEEKEDELIELATLFAEERFEGTKVGTIKAFKFDGGEVLVGKGMHYFLVVRCTGTEFDRVATEIKRSIINIDVGIGESIAKWYPGQRLTPLEDELRSLLGGVGQ